MRSLLIGGLLLLLVGCGGSASRIAAACEDSGQEAGVCECMGEKLAALELSTETTDALVAQMSGDDTALSGGNIDMAEGMKAGMALFGASLECAATPTG